MIQTLLKVPAGLAAAPAAAAQDGGSLMETATVPILGFVIMLFLFPPVQLTTTATAMTSELKKSETGWPFSQCRTWAIT